MKLNELQRKIAETQRRSAEERFKPAVLSWAEKVSSRKRSQFCSLFRDELKKSLSLCFLDLSGQYFAEMFDVKPRNHSVEAAGV